MYNTEKTENWYQAPGHMTIVSSNSYLEESYLGGAIKARTMALSFIDKKEKHLFYQTT